MAEPSAHTHLDKVLTITLDHILNEIKERNTAERSKISQKIKSVKEDREENLLKIADLRDAIAELEESVKQVEENNNTIIKASVGTQKNRKLDILHKEKVIEMIKREEKNEYLSWDLMTRLYAHIFNASKNELIELSEQEQKERRKYIDNPRVWVDIFTTYSLKLETLSKKWEVKVLEELGVSEKLFYKSAQKFLIERPQDIMLFNEQLMAKARVERAKNKESKVSIEQYKQILREQNDFIKNNSHNLLNLKQYLNFPDVGLFTNLVRLRIMDHLNEKFGIEEEDLALFLEQFQAKCFSDPGIQELMAKADELLLTLGG
mmetsp:Transcript_39471/g.45922  ORF Transcript_39471/g.45922 Transcript_39471/m.45922 type:complete len:319 (+) Transcript_39471:18-974(+)|eukprot:CAMPEP_0176416030 /NCGR_PEP_ID=MMETSP0127-20121128/6125_1 /TAXON_ID=938130 /ORGANISM="Platyophrya macrostoma, Strain WH" /LENGTH=318 /DNA_ID=CAMNT_0017796071 /DNA_START=7 /DNA_END=963 /DNA_ORIENTATION=-